MASQTQVDNIQTISHQHANGEVFGAKNLEMARAMCHVLGSMSVEEAGLLVELEAMGKELLADQKEVRHEKPVIRKIEKVEQKPKEINIPSKVVVKVTQNEALRAAETSARQMAQPLTEKSSDRTITKPTEPDLLAIQVQHAEATRIVSSTYELFETAGALDVGETKLLEKQDTIPRPEEPHPNVNTEIVKAPISLGVHQEVEKQAIVSREYITHQLDKNPLEQTLNELTRTESQAVDAEPVVTNIEFPPADKMPVEPVWSEPAGIVTVTNTTELSETELSTTDDANIDDSLFEAVEVPPVTASFDESDIEQQTDQEILSSAAEFAQTTEERSEHLINLETNPLIAVHELPAPIVKIENTVEQLVKVIERDEVKESGRAAAILETIIAIPRRAELAAGNNAEALEEKLEELFIELFEEANTPYSAELVESFVKLTKAHYPEDLLEITKESGKERKGLPDEIGTHEFLQKLQYGLSATKQAVINCYELGKSVLRLYSFSTEAAVLG